MKDIKELNMKEMEMVNGGEAMEACDVIEEAEAFDACDGLGYNNSGVLCKRVKRYRQVRVNGVMKTYAFYAYEPVEENK